MHPQAVLTARMKAAIGVPGRGLCILPGSPGADGPRMAAASPRPGMRALPIVKVSGNEYFLGERLMALRTVVDVNARVPLKEHHPFHYRLTGRTVLD